MPAAEILLLPDSVAHAERAVLGAMTTDADTCRAGASLLKPQDFFSETNKKVFLALSTIAAENGEPGFEAVLAELDKKRQLDACGGPQGIALILEAQCHPKNLSATAQIVREASRKRRIRRLAAELKTSTEDPSRQSNELLSSALTELAALEEQDRAENFQPLDLEGAPEPIPWILENWMIEGDLGLFCGPPGEGKSTTMAALALSLSSGLPPWEGGPRPLRTAPVVYIDVEMGPQSTRRAFQRLMAGMALTRTPQGLLPVSCPGEVSLVSSDGLRRIQQAIMGWAQQNTNLGPPVLMIDTLSGALSGLESFNDAALLEPLYRTLFQWRDQIGCTTVLSHHPRKRGQWETGAPTLDQVRDSTTHTGKCSVVWFAQKPARGATCLDIYCLKNRGRDKAATQRVSYHSEGNNAPIRLKLEDSPQAEPEGEVERTEKLIADFVLMRGEQGARSADIMAFANSENVKERTTKRALTSLIALNVITKRDRRGHYWSSKLNTPGLLQEPTDDQD